MTAVEGNFSFLINFELYRSCRRENDVENFTRESPTKVTEIPGEGRRIAFQFGQINIRQRGDSGCNYFNDLLNCWMFSADNLI